MVSTKSFVLDINIPMKVRDGTTLYADIYRPNTEGKYPAILIRMPYTKKLFSLRRGESYLDFKRVASEGYVVIIQDVRGTGESEGEFYLLRSEPNDGYDTIEWLAEQSWCDGNVGMYGFSYYAFTPWAAAVARPPHLKAICPSMHTVFGRGEPPVLNGVFHPNPSLEWFIGFVQNAFRRSKLPPDKLKELQEQLYNIQDHYLEQLSFLPMKETPVIKIAEELGMPLFYSDWLTYIDNDDYWARLCSPVPFEKVVVPVMHITGWYDVLRGGILGDFQEMRKRGGSELARKNQKLLVGPWSHDFQFSNMVGELNFGVANSGSSIDLTGIHLRWFDYWLKNISNGVMDEPPVRIFVMGDNVWRNENEWPLTRTKYTKYYFHSRGLANTRSGDGILSEDSPGEEQSDNFLYNPKNPVPTGGMGAHDQELIERRQDVLVYTSSPLETDIEVTGPIEIKLWAATSAVDTDFTAKLVDVWPNGKAYNLADGIVRARYRDSISEAKLVEPGRVYEYSIDLQATSNVFKAGHCIRVQISSSDFPANDRNLNTGHPVGQDAEIKVAMQTIYHTNLYPSHILLPIIPR